MRVVSDTVVPRQSSAVLHLVVLRHLHPGSKDELFVPAEPKMLMMFEADVVMRFYIHKGIKALLKAKT